MATPRVVGGYQYRDLIERGEIATRHARSVAKKILDEHPGPGMAALYMAQIAIDLGTLDEVLHDLAAIGAKSTTPEA